MAIKSKKNVKIKLKEEPKEKILLKEEMLQLQLLNSEVELANAVKSIVLANENTLRLQAKLIEKELRSLDQEKIKLIEKQNKFNNNLKEKYKIDNKQWGYDPITGVIK